jgi:hypothetical protein
MLILAWLIEDSATEMDEGVKSITERWITDFWRRVWLCTTLPQIAMPVQECLQAADKTAAMLPMLPAHLNQPGAV